MSLLRKSLLQVSKTFAHGLHKKSGFIILAYHSVPNGNPTSLIDTPFNRFKDQIFWLIDNGYQFISFKEALEMKDYGSIKYITLTFDDGYLDYLENVVPFLSSKGISSTVYVITKFLQDRTLSYNFASGKNKAPMRLEHIQELNKNKLVNIGSHTHTHSDLSQVKDSNRLLIETERSKKLIQELTNKDNIDFCYPWARHNQYSYKSISSLYQSAVIGKGGKNDSHTNKFKLRRIPIKYGTLSEFESRIKFHSFAEDWIRDKFNL
ncbi:MAG TPA: polysaccharide deacetylase family protein [Bacteroidetes bacterium]|nr:polysaccharide deacetylase family protein [Bacteroidota bacterium]